MIPVEQTSTWSGLHLSSRATAAAVARDAARPAAPVAQLALPELQPMARAFSRDLARCCCEMITGAAFTWFVVKTAAATASEPEVMSARSGRPLALSPHAPDAKRNPRGTCAGSIG